MLVMLVILGRISAYNTLSMSKLSASRYLFVNSDDIKQCLNSIATFKFTFSAEASEQVFCFFVLSKLYFFLLNILSFFLLSSTLFYFCLEKFFLNAYLPTEGDNQSGLWSRYGENLENARLFFYPQVWSTSPKKNNKSHTQTSLSKLSANLDSVHLDALKK